ncbi:unnamed protein product [Cercospora beticola]|nr:unnamed protein product [Cercospora beticola]
MTAAIAILMLTSTDLVASHTVHATAAASERRPSTPSRQPDTGGVPSEAPLQRYRQHRVGSLSHARSTVVSQERDEEKQSKVQVRAKHAGRELLYARCWMVSAAGHEKEAVKLVPFRSDY